MNVTMSCSVAQDLIPLYIDHLTSEETNQWMEEHMQECEDCKNRYERMKESNRKEEVEKQKEINSEVDYLKKIHSYQKKNLILGSIVSFLLGASIPVLRVAIPIIIDLSQGGEIPQYKIARINLVWYIGVIQMGCCGLVFLGIYLFINALLKRRK